MEARSRERPAVSRNFAYHSEQPAHAALPLLRGLLLWKTFLGSFLLAQGCPGPPLLSLP